MPTALLGKKVDAFIVADPFNALAEQRFNARIMRYTGDIWKNHPCCVIAAAQPFIDQHPVVVQKAMNAIVRAQAWCRKNPKETAHLLSRDGERYLPVSQEVLHRVFEPPDPARLKHPEWNVHRIDFQPFPFPSATRFIIDQMKTTRVEGDTAFLSALDSGRAVQDLVDDRFVLQAMDEAGGMAPFCDCNMDFPYTREETVELI
jgi:NitT/TauT family transport system substrate-binding protein